MTNTNAPAHTKDTPLQWLLRLFKGILIGIGGITPGLSGGVLAVVFGLYEPLMRFLADFRRAFWRNVLFFIPVGVGVIGGVVAFSAVVDYAFSNFAAQFIWLFIGFICGTFPSLFKTAGKQGRAARHWVILAAAAIAIYAFMHYMQSVRSVQLPQTFFSWVLSGALFGLGVVVPGMSPSNFIIYLGLYQPMAAGIKSLDFSVIIPLGIGVVLCVLLFAQLVNWLFKVRYTLMYHIILGIVVGSTLAIIPSGVRGWTIAVCALMFIAGAAASYALARLDEKVRG